MMVSKDSWFANSHPLSEWIAQAKAGDVEAARKLWTPCFELLLRIARRSLNLGLTTVADEEDVALDAFFDVWRGITGQHFAELQNRRDLWCLLWKIAKRKAIDHHRVFTRRGRIPHALPADVLDGFSGNGEDDAIVTCLSQDLYNCLPESLQPVAALLLSGATNQQIAAKMNISVRMLQRRCALIESRWVKLLSTP